jgi:hypothetical protein
MPCPAQSLCIAHSLPRGSQMGGSPLSPTCYVCAHSPPLAFCFASFLPFPCRSTHGLKVFAPHNRTRPRSCPAPAVRFVSSRPHCPSNSASSQLPVSPENIARQGVLSRILHPLHCLPVHLGCHLRMGQEYKRWLAHVHKRGLAHTYGTFAGKHQSTVQRDKAMQNTMASHRGVGQGSVPGQAIARLRHYSAS